MQIKKIFLEKRQGAFIIRAVMFIRINMLIYKNCWGGGGGGGVGSHLHNYLPVQVKVGGGSGSHLHIYLDR